ncbi:MAG TPA: glucose-1-phosphate thymidylyltransferase [Crenotrichaceae bacterium]|nr:glucose-1-phosphate thymidylyltransferase [Crenotrichaceae bacterium]
MQRKGILLAGGSGTRLHPLTQSISKQLLPVFDKPMVYYPLCVLMLADIREILLITTPHDQPLFKNLLGNGSQWGIEINYAVQPEPNGLAEAFIIGKNFVADHPSCLVLGDNIYYGHGFQQSLQRADQQDQGATVFGYWVNDPERYGVVEFDSEGKAIGVEEKPDQPKSNYAITGLYFYDQQVTEMVASLKPSSRGELEITDLNRLYLHQNQLQVERLGRGIAWLDTGTHGSLMQASNFIQTIEERQGLKVCCPEEIAYAAGWITADQLEQIAAQLCKNQYGQYLYQILKLGRPV